MKLVFLVHIFATLTMFGAIWIVQVVHYPLFSGVGESGWAAYEASHQARITWIVGPAMVLELATAIWLLFDPPPAFPMWALVAGAVLVALIWASTAFIQVPLHTTLSAGFDADAHARLVGTNWIRTVLWSLRTGLVLWLASLAIGRAL